jgi:ATPases involved in chromosome partitioning
VPLKIAMYNHKGGVGKTTDSVILGYGMLNKGKKVLLIDLDAQQYLSLSLLDTESLDTTNTTFELAKRQEKIPPKEVKVKLLNGEESSIFVLPTTEQDTVKMIRGEYPQTDPFALRDVIDQYNEFDVIIMDLPPQVTPSMWWGLFAAEYVIIPITASEFSQYGAYVYAKEVLPRLTRSTKVRTLGFLLGNVIVRNTEKLISEVRKDLQEYMGNVVVMYPELRKYIYKDVVFSTIINQTAELRFAIRGRDAYPPVFEMLRVSNYPPTVKLREATTSVANEIEKRTSNFISLGD